MTTYNPPFAAYGEQHLRWIENTDAAGLRRVGFADEICEIRHRGWFTDAGEVYRGSVYQLPARRGNCVYVYGYDDPYNPAAALLSFDWTNDKDEAGRWADHIAERAAEKQRASNARLEHDEHLAQAADLAATWAHHPGWQDA